jgi:hypothetical protein
MEQVEESLIPKGSVSGILQLVKLDFTHHLVFLTDIADAVSKSICSVWNTS